MRRSPCDTSFFSVCASSFPTGEAMSLLNKIRNISADAASVLERKWPFLNQHTGKHTVGSVFVNTETLGEHGAVKKASLR